jgi:hypothetical protein
MTIASLLALVFLFSFLATPNAEMAKEGTESAKAYFHGTHQSLAMEEESVQVIWEVWGVSVSDTVEGLFHNLSFHCLGAVYAVKGVFDNETGMCEYTRPNGDKVYTTFKAAGEFGKPIKGRATIIGGTGEVKNISGSMEYETNILRPAAEGTFQGYVNKKWHWKIP